ncbi:MAG: fibronectin type III domain-containing protein [Chloroflexi bacterium]|nr:fibronectin type III domain-containing protein [Chloroflexota bacterium]
MFVLAVPVGVADELSAPAVSPWQITVDPAADVEPVVAVDEHGRAYIAWKRLSADGSSAELVLARAPNWEPIPLASISPSRKEQTPLGLMIGPEAARIAWSEPATSTVQLLSVPLNMQAPATPAAVLTPTVVPLPQAAHMSLDTTGQLHVAWANGRTISYAPAPALTPTLTITSPAAVNTLDWKLDASGAPHFAWLAADAGEVLQIHYSGAPSERTLVKVGRQLYTPVLAVGKTGPAHLCWRDGGHLVYANSQDWTVSYRVAENLSVEAPFALFADSAGIAHLAWYAEGALWYASSVDWQVSKRQLAAVSALDDLSMAVDAVGNMHIAWAAPDERGNWEVYYLAPEPLDLQVAVLYPRGGDLVTEDTLIRVAANLAANDVLSVEFYLQAADDESGELVYLGRDDNGRDGWAMPLRPAQFTQAGAWRVVALGMDARGRLARAYGDPFIIQPPHLPWAWLQAPELARGRVSLMALAGAAEHMAERLHLYFTPTGRPPLDVEAQQPISPTVYYGGAFSLSARQTAEGKWQNVPVDSRRLPDGSYRAWVVATDQLSHTSYSPLDAPIQVDNSMAPRVTITSPKPQAVLDEFVELVAEVEDADGTVRRVDFYLERDRPLLQGQDAGQRYALETTQSLWLGSDHDGTDGWRVQVQVTPALDGDEWYARAIAYDDAGLSASARSAGSFCLVGDARPRVHVLTPTEGSALRGVERVRLYLTEGLQYLTGATAYVQDMDDVLHYLGEMNLIDGLWGYDWDTTTLPNGQYTLRVVVRCQNGRELLLHVDDLRIENSPASYYFETPAKNETLVGPTVVRMEARGDTPGNLSVQFYYRAPDGQLFHIGPGIRGADGWSAIWDTQAVLDGAYDLLAEITDGQGGASFVERPVRVQNTSLSVALRDFDATSPWRGDRRITWDTQSNQNGPVAASIAYSPDGGAHWVEVADQITDAHSFLWNTRQYPDSTEALLRVSITDGSDYAETISPVFQVNNSNEPPQVSLLAPRAGSVQAGEMRIAWQAHDPDGDPITVDLEYRQGDGEWRPIGRGLAATGAYSWRLASLSPGEGYEVRALARDPLGVIAADAAERLQIVQNSPPTVELLWPNTATRLDKETVILWQAHDADQDNLLIDLFYSENAGQTWLPLAEGVPNTGYYVWQVSYLPAGTQYRLRVLARDEFFQATDESDQLFAIGERPLPEIALLSPAPGASLSGMALLQWSVGQASADYSIGVDIRETGSEEWTALARKLPDNGFYMLDTAGYADGDYDLRVAVMDDGSALVRVVQPVTISNNRNHVPQVRLFSPHGGEVWTGIQEVAWQAWDRDGDVITATLQVSVDGGERWARIATLDARVGRYLWDTRHVELARDYLLRVVVSDGQTSTTATSSGPFYLANQRGRPPTVLLLSPDAAGKLAPGAGIAWVAEDPDGDPLRVSVSISADDGVNWVDLLRDASNTGEYALDEEALKLGLTYRVRVVADDGIHRVQAVSGAFQPMTPPGQTARAEFLAPLGATVWSGEQEIRWRIQDAPLQALMVDLDVSADGGLTWTPLASGIPDAGAYTWDTQKVANGAYRLRLRVYDSHPIATCISKPFRIDNANRNAPVISVVSPQAGETLSGLYQIRWRTYDPDGGALGINLYYSLDRGASWNLIAYDLADAGRYTWDTATIPNSEQVWLRATVHDGDLAGREMVVGPLTVLNTHVPAVKLIAPQGGEHVAGNYLIRWHATQPENPWATASLDASVDGGRTWQRLAANLPLAGSYLWDTAGLAAGSEVLLRVKVADGLRSAVGVTAQPVVIAANPPALDLLYRYH